MIWNFPLAQSLFLLFLLFVDRGADFSDDEDEFSSNDEGEAEGSDSEPMPEDGVPSRRPRKSSRGKIPANARVSKLFSFFLLFYLSNEFFFFLLKNGADTGHKSPLIAFLKWNNYWKKIKIKFINRYGIEVKSLL